jgi:hypothetical protein
MPTDLLTDFTAIRGSYTGNCGDIESVFIECPNGVESSFAEKLGTYTVSTSTMSL